MLVKLLPPLRRINWAQTATSLSGWSLTLINYSLNVKNFYLFLLLIDLFELPPLQLILFTFQMLVIPTSPSNVHPTVIAFPFSIFAMVHQTVRTDTTKMRDYAQQVNIFSCPTRRGFRCLAQFMWTQLERCVIKCHDCRAGCKRLCVTSTRMTWMI